jgi:hypothetical protein
MDMIKALKEISAARERPQSARACGAVRVLRPISLNHEQVRERMERRSRELKSIHIGAVCGVALRSNSACRTPRVCSNTPEINQLAAKRCEQASAASQDDDLGISAQTKHHRLGACNIGPHASVQRERYPSSERDGALSANVHACEIGTRNRDTRCKNAAHAQRCGPTAEGGPGRGACMPEKSTRQGSHSASHAEAWTNSPQVCPEKDVCVRNKPGEPAATSRRRGDVAAHVAEDLERKRQTEDTHVERGEADDDDEVIHRLLTAYRRMASMRHGVVATCRDAHECADDIPASPATLNGVHDRKSWMHDHESHECAEANALTSRQTLEKRGDFGEGMQSVTRSGNGSIHREGRRQTSTHQGPGTNEKHVPIQHDHTRGGVKNALEDAQGCWDTEVSAESYVAVDVTNAVIIDARR